MTQFTDNNIKRNAKTYVNDLYYKFGHRSCSVTDLNKNPNKLIAYSVFSMYDQLSGKNVFGFGDYSKSMFAGINVDYTNRPGYIHQLEFTDKKSEYEAKIQQIEAMAKANGIIVKLPSYQEFMDNVIKKGQSVDEFAASLNFQTYNEYCLDLINNSDKQGKDNSNKSIIDQVITTNGSLNVEEKNHKTVGSYMSWTPDFITHDAAGIFMPDGMAAFTVHEQYLDTQTTIEQAMASLPKCEDGSYDTDKIRGALVKAYIITSEINNVSKEKLNYGRYKESFNDVDLWNFIFLFEQAGVLEALGLPEAHIGSPLKLLTKIAEIFNNSDNAVKSTIRSRLAAIGWNEWAGSVDEFFYIITEYSLVKDSHSIIDQIDADNKALEDLLNIDLSTEDGIKQMLEKYKEITGTAFSYNEIVEFSEDNYKMLDKDKQKQQLVQLFGMKPLYNALDTMQNNIVTSALYHGVYKVALPNALGNIPYAGPVLKTLVPFQVELTEQLSSGCKEGEWINWNKVTAGTLAKVAADGFFYAMFNGAISNGGSFFNCFKKDGNILKFFDKSPVFRRLTFARPMLKYAEKVQNMRLPKGLRWLSGLIGGPATWMKCGERAGIRSAIINTTGNVADYCTKAYKKETGIWDRLGSLGANAATGGVFIPLSIIDCAAESQRHQT